MSVAATARNPHITIRRAYEELDTARSEKDTLAGRQAAEKAWLAVVEATDRFLGSKGIRVPPDSTAHVERRRGLRALGRHDLAKTYNDLSNSLHGDVFYFGEDYTSQDLDLLFREAAEYVEETTGVSGIVKELLEARLRRDVLKE